MMARVNQALKAEKDGETLEWKNDATPASGSVTPLARFSDNGVACRRLRIVNVYADSRHRASTGSARRRPASGS